MNRYARSDDDYSRRKAACGPLRQASMQWNERPFHSTNYLQEDSE
jgi:hypothetical protein